MANKIGVGIEVDTSGLTQAQKDIERVNRELGGAGPGGGSGSSQAAADLRRQEDQARKTAEAYKRLEEQAKKTRDAIKGMIGRDVTMDQARAVDMAFSRFQHSGTAQSSYTSGYSGFSGWSGGHQQQFSSVDDARMHRSYVLDRVLGRAGVTLPPAPIHQPPSQFNQWANAASWGAAGHLAGSVATGNPAAALPSLGAGIGGALRFVPGVGMALGAFGAALGGMAGSAAQSGVGSAQNEFMALTDLRGNLGKLNTDFEVLRRGVELAADGMSITYVEATNLGKRFMEMSGGRGVNQLSLGGELSIAGGLSRGYGLDPSQGVSFMSSLRRYGATNDEAGTRRMALLIGEAVGRVGFARAGEMMQAVTGFVSTSQRSLSTPNVGGYVNALSRMVGLHPGLDVPGAAGILNRANSAFMSGGAAGPASQNFMLGVYQNALGKDVSGLMTPFLNAQGLFGTAGGARGLLLGNDGKGGVLKGKDRASVSAILGGLGAGTGTPMIDLMMGGIKKQYGDGTLMQIHAVAGHLGISPVEAAGLIEMHNKPGGIGGMAAKLKAAGIDASKIKAQNIPALSAILGAGGGDLRDMAGQYGVKAGGKSDDVIRREVLKAASEKTVEDEGEKTRRTITGVENAITGLGAGLLPAVNMVRDAVLFVGGKDPDKLASEQAKWLKSKAAGGLLSGGIGTMTPLERKEFDRLNREGRWQDANKMRDAAQSRLVGGVDDFMADASAEGLTPAQAKLALSIYGQESNYGRADLSKNGKAKGVMQMTPGTFSAFSEQGWDINNPSQNRRAAMRYIKHLWQKSGGDLRKTAGGYYGGEGVISNWRDVHDPDNPNAPGVFGYADQVLNRMDGLADGAFYRKPEATMLNTILDRTPGRTGKSGAGSAWEPVDEITIRLLYPDGRSQSSKVPIPKKQTPRMP